MELIKILLVALASELGFVISFMLTSILSIFLYYFYTLIHLENRYRWMLDGILCGCISIFISTFISFKLTQSQHLGNWLVILIGCILPVIGEIGYLRKISKNKKPVFLTRIHDAMRVFFERFQFASIFNSQAEKKVASGNFSVEDLKDKTLHNEMAQYSHEHTQGYFYIVFLWSILGYFLGILLIYRFILN